MQALIADFGVTLPKLDPDVRKQAGSAHQGPPWVVDSVARLRLQVWIRNNSVRDFGLAHLCLIAGRTPEADTRQATRRRLAHRPPSDSLIEPRTAKTKLARTVMRARDLRGMTEDRWLA
jgi:hypothetical protein